MVRWQSDAAGSTNAALSLHDAMLSSERDYDRNIGVGNVSLRTFCTAPRRMFLCDVPLFTEQTIVNRNDGVDYLRLMGTVVEIIQTSDSSTDISRGINPQHANENASSSNEFPTHQLIHFVIDDGTGSIEVFTKRRVAQSKNSSCSTNSHVQQCNNKSAKLRSKIGAYCIQILKLSLLRRWNHFYLRHRPQF
jgi:hypothetical protein